MNYLQQRLELFSNKSFLWYVVSCATAMFGNGLTYVAMTWVLTNQPHQVTHIALLMIFFWLPGILIGPLAGVFIDRYSRKHILAFCNMSRVIMLFVFWLLLHEQPSPLALYVLACCSGIILSIYIPTALTLVREIVMPDKLLYANATVDMAYEIGAVVGMGFAGLIISLTSVKTTFLINALCFLSATLALTQVKNNHTSNNVKEEPAWTAFKLGTRYLLQNPFLLAIYLIQMLFFVSYMTAPILLAPFAKLVLHTTITEFGFIEGAMSVGIILGGVLTPYLCQRFGFFKTMLGQASTCCLSFLYFGHNHNIAHAILCYWVIGFCFSAWPLLITHAQEKTDFTYQGRVQSLFNSLAGTVILSVYLGLATVGDNYAKADLYWFEVGLMALAIFLLFAFNKTWNMKAASSP